MKRLSVKTVLVLAAGIGLGSTAPANKDEDGVVFPFKDSISLASLLHGFVSSIGDEQKSKGQQPTSATPSAGTSDGTQFLDLLASNLLPFQGPTDGRTQQLADGLTSLLGLSMNNYPSPLVDVLSRPDLFVGLLRLAKLGTSGRECGLFCTVEEMVKKRMEKLEKCFDEDNDNVLCVVARHANEQLEEIEEEISHLEEEEDRECGPICMILKLGQKEVEEAMEEAVECPPAGGAGECQCGMRCLFVLLNRLNEKVKDAKAEITKLQDGDEGQCGFLCTAYSYVRLQAEEVEDEVRELKPGQDPQCDLMCMIHAQAQMEIKGLFDEIKMQQEEAIDVQNEVEGGEEDGQKVIQGGEVPRMAPR